MAVFHYQESSGFDFSQAPLYRKTAKLPKSNVEIVEHQQVVVTVLGGLEETINTAQIGDKIITGVQGERYILKPENFANLYEEDPNDKSCYRSKNIIYAARLNNNIEITAPWGNRQRAVKCGYVAQRFGNPMDIYLIEEEAFHSTYGLETSSVNI